MQNTKKSVLLLVCALTVIGLIAVQALAETTIIDSGTYGEDLTWTIDSNYRLTISGTGDMQQTYIDDISMDFPWETYRF